MKEESHRVVGPHPSVSFFIAGSVQETRKESALLAGFCPNNKVCRSQDATQDDETFDGKKPQALCTAHTCSWRVNDTQSDFCDRSDLAERRAENKRIHSDLHTAHLVDLIHL